MRIGKYTMKSAVSLFTALSCSFSYIPNAKSEVIRIKLNGTRIVGLDNIVEDRLVEINRTNGSTVLPTELGPYTPEEVASRLARYSLHQRGPTFFYEEEKCLIPEEKIKRVVASLRDRICNEAYLPVRDSIGYATAENSSEVYGGTVKVEVGKMEKSSVEVRVNGRLSSRATRDPPERTGRDFNGGVIRIDITNEVPRDDSIYPSHRRRDSFDSPFSTDQSELKKNLRAREVYLKRGIFRRKGR